MYRMAAVLIACSASLLATGTSSCSDPASSGCSPWWVTYSTGNAGDGSFGRTTGVSPVFTSTFTNVAASQDPLSATFSWMSSSGSNASSVVTSNYSNWSVNTDWSPDYNSASFTSPSYTSYSTSYVSSSTNATYTSNLASMLPGSGSDPVSPIFIGTPESYSAWFSSVYLQTYGNRSPVVPGAPSVQLSAAALDPVPEPGTLVGVGVGLALLTALQVRRRGNSRK